MGYNPSVFQGSDLPVEYVSWVEVDDIAERSGDGFQAKRTAFRNKAALLSDLRKDQRESVVGRRRWRATVLAAGLPQLLRQVQIGLSCGVLA